MIWQSIFLMTLIDILIVGIVGSASFYIVTRRQKFQQYDSRTGYVAVMTGMGLLGCFYLADLLTMHALPRFFSVEESMVIMRELHLNYRWIVSLCGIGLVAFGFLGIQSANFRLFASVLESEERYRTLVQTAPLCIHEIDLDGKLTSMNSAGLGMMGVEGDSEILGLDYLSIPDAKDQERVAAHFAEALRGTPVSFEFQSTDGSAAISFESCFVPIKSDDGNVVKVMGISQDITARKSAEENLQLSQNRLQAIFDNAPVEIYLKDIEGRYVQINQQFEQLFNVKNEEIIGRLPEDVHYSELALQTREHDLRVLESGQPHIAEQKCITESGKRILHTVKFPVFVAGEVTGLGAVVTDITDLQRVQDALTDSDEQLRQAIGLVGLGHAVWDANLDKCIYCSEQYARIHGVSAKEYLQRASNLEGEMTLVHPEDHEAFLERIEQSKQGHDFDLKYRVLKPDGEVRFVREVAKQLARDSGGMIEEICTMQDITESKLVEEQLREAHKMRAVGQLTGGIAHDFNNLLAIISGNAELIASGRHGDKDKLVQSIIRAADNGAELTQRLLAFSRRQPLSPQSVNLGEVIANLPKLLERTLGEHILVDVNCPPDLWLGFVDPNQLENALINLAINARDAMPTGGKLTLSGYNAKIDQEFAEFPPDLEEGEYVALVVSDTGTGMTADVLQSAFEPFFTTKEVGLGSGLGLSMVYGFVKQSGGHVVIDSKDGQGAAVTVYIPRNKQIVQAEPAAQVNDLPTGQGETVLVLEDNKDMAVVVTTMLGHLDYQAITVSEVSGARAILETKHVDIVLSDVVLPGGTSGQQFAEELRTKSPKMKIVLMSGFDAQSCASKPDIKSEQELLQKPFSMHQLAQAIRKELDQDAIPNSQFRQAPYPTTVH